MVKTAIIYYSSHHGNTKKLVDAIAQDGDVTLIDAAEQKRADLGQYDLIGFASGVYGGRFHPDVLDFARKNLPEGKRVFFLYTYAGLGSAKSIAAAAAEKSAVVAGEFCCKGFNTFGPFKLVGGTGKGRPNEADLENARRFFHGICG
ncbi:MAG: flavodoxin [Oscillospiraceae bacterium]